MADGLDVDTSHYNSMEVTCTMTSTGFNKNDHYFIPSILYSKKETPKYQMVDWEHDTSFPIGCISDTYIVDFDGNEVNAADIKINENLNFDLDAKLIIWKGYFPEDAEKVVDKKKNENLCVSMEALVYDFLIAVYNAETKETKYVELNNDTSFMLKYMKNFGGSGYYKQYRLGMAFVDYVFSGIGLTTDPANPRSKIKEIVDENIKVAKQNKNFDKENKENCVDVNNDDNLCSVLGDKEKMDKKELDEKIAAKEAELESLKAELEKVSKEAKESADKVVESAKTIEQLNKIAEDIKAASAKKLEDTVKEYDVKLSSMVAEKTASDKRIAELSTKIKNDERKAKATTLAVEIPEAELLAFTDDAFEAVLKYSVKKEQKVEEVKKANEEIVVEVEKVEEKKEAVVEVIKEEKKDTENKELVAQVASLIGAFSGKKVKKSK